MCVSPHHPTPATTSCLLPSQNSQNNLAWASRGSPLPLYFANQLFPKSGTSGFHLLMARWWCEMHRVMPLMKHGGGAGGGVALPPS